MTTEQNKYQNYLFVSLVIMLTATSVGCHMFKIPPIMGELAKSLSMGSSVSWLMSIFIFVGIFLAIPAGSMAQKFGPKAMIVWAAVITAAGSIIGSFATNSGLMIASRGIEGIGYIMVTVCGPLAIGRYVESSKMGLAMGIWATWGPIGGILGLNVVAAMYSSLNWNSIWLVFAVVSVVMAAVTQFLVNNKMGNVSTAESVNGPAPKLTDVFSQKNLWLICLTFGTFCSIFLAMSTFAPVYLETSGMMSKSAAAFVTTIPMIISMISLPLIGKVSDMVKSIKKPLILSLIVLGPSAALMFSTNTAFVYIGAILFGAIGMGVAVLTLSAVGEVVERPELVGPAMGLAMIFQNLGQFLGTLYFMPIVGMVGGSFTTAGLVLIPIAVVALIFVLIAKLK